jgi:hypothetical protein
MPKIAVITQPDKLFNNDPSVLLIYPSNDVKQQFQTQVEDLDISLNVYVYNQESTEHNFDWLLSVMKMCDITIFDIDNSESEVRNLASYIVANSDTYWLTKDPSPVYNYLSVKRIYDLTFITEGVLRELQKK